MDVSSNSGESDDNAPGTIYEEVVVNSVSQQLDQKEPSISAGINSHKLKSQVRDSDIETGSESEDEDEEHSYSAVRSCELSKNSTNIGGESKQTTNIKLVLKKSSGFEIANHSLVQAKTSPNKIFLVTLVSNASPTKPVFTTSYTSSSVRASVPVTATNAQDSLISSEILTNQISKTLEEGSTVRSKMNSEQKIKGEHTNSSSIYEKRNTDGISTSRDDGDDIETKSESEIKANVPKIKRELIQLQKTVNESKILSEYMSESASFKGRKSRKLPLKPGSDTEYSPSGVGRRSRSRSRSKTRGESPLDGPDLSKWPSEERINKRQNMRSQNTEFVQKHMRFLNRINAEGEESDHSDGENSVNDTKPPVVESQQQVIKRCWLPPPRAGWDSFCWKCHTCGELIPCSKCIRSYHLKCLKKHGPGKDHDEGWVCPECLSFESCMKGQNKSGKTLSAEQLNQLLQFALKRMMALKGHEQFAKKVSEQEHLEYYKYILNPITLETLQSKVENKIYKCTEEFAADSKWIHHNAMIYFGSSKLPNIAKSIVKVCRQEVTEIETCPECYYNANTREGWFVEVCSKPHMLLWAKLKGFPYWPAKAMGLNSAGLVNVRFFGDYDRAYIPIKECFLYSEKDPNPPTKQNKRNNVTVCIQEVLVHIEKITAKFGSFVYAPFRTPYDPTKELTQLEMMIPGVTEHMNSTQESPKQTLTYKIVKTADNNLSFIKKSDLRNGDANNDNKATTSHSTLTESCKINSNESQKKFSDEVDTNKSDEPMKIEISAVKTYEVVSRKDDSNAAKISSVILKRKPDIRSTAISSSAKKCKISSESDSNRSEQVTSSCSDGSTHKGIVNKDTSVDEDIAMGYKQQLPEEESVTNTQKVTQNDAVVSNLTI